ncbi:MAG: RNA methyltransferase, partial [Bacteroidales bacterium]|nr:RNA methyltransferase [Bacteroidales bacterium]
SFVAGAPQDDSIRLIAYCFEDPSIPRQSIMDVLRASDSRDITILIGPEGDFSQEEAALALKNGYRPIHLGPSRLRTETAAVTAVEAVYLYTL